MNFKKFLAILLALVMVLSLVACGGDAGDDVDVDDSTDPNQSDSADDTTSPLDVMNFVEVPDYIVGTRWEFSGGFLNGVEMTDEQASAMLESNGGVLEIDVDDVDAASYITGSETLSGSCGVTEDNMALVLTLPNEDGTTSDNYCRFADLDGTDIMVLTDSTATNGLYFRMIEEG